MVSVLENFSYFCSWRTHERLELLVILSVRLSFVSPIFAISLCRASLPPNPSVTSYVHIQWNLLSPSFFPWKVLSQMLYFSRKMCDFLSRKINWQFFSLLKHTKKMSLGTKKLQFCGKWWNRSGVQFIVQKNTEQAIVNTFVSKVFPFHFGPRRAFPTHMYGHSGLHKSRAHSLQKTCSCPTSLQHEVFNTQISNSKSALFFSKVENINFL